MIRNKVVWDKHYNSNRLTVRNIFLFCYSRFRLMCIFNFAARYNSENARSYDVIEIQSMRTKHYVYITDGFFFFFFW